MKYIFLNYFIFENLESNAKCTPDVLISIFRELAHLLKDIRTLNCELIIDSRLSNLCYLQKNIFDYLRLSSLEKEALIPLLIKLQKPVPFCSNSYDEYFEDEEIVLGDCKVKDTEINILENCLACALYLDEPILTSKILCTLTQFLQDSILIECKKGNIRNLNNLFLEDKAIFLQKIEDTLKKSFEDWATWRRDCLPLYRNISITDDCFEDIKVYSISSKYISSIFQFFEKINNFCTGKNIQLLNFDECCSYTSKESETRLRTFKQQLTVKNAQGEKEIANWHTRINNDFRLYFTIDTINNKICFIKFTKKIS